MSLISGTLSPKGPLHELTDRFEILCLTNKGRFSYQEFKSILGILKDEDHTSGVLEEDEEDSIVDDITHQIETRNRLCGENYPFQLKNSGYSIEIKPKVRRELLEVYQFLLFATRVNMGTKRVQANIDGSKVFEEISEQVMRNYFGNHAKSNLFGTAGDETEFSQKINTLISNLKEGGKFSPRPGTNYATKNDGGLDLAAWIPFADGFPGQLIGFGQCKTGSSWQTELTKLQPEAFMNLWFERSTTIVPVRFFFIAEGPLRSNWSEIVVASGVLFDRFRLMNYLPKLETNLQTKVSKWGKAVLAQV